jgi:hypothetical protein
MEEMCFSAIPAAAPMDISLKNVFGRFAVFGDVVAVYFVVDYDFAVYDARGV